MARKLTTEETVTFVFSRIPDRPVRSQWLGREPRLSEIMEDPIVHLMMAVDGVAAEDVWRLARQVQDRAGGRAAVCGHATG